MNQFEDSGKFGDADRRLLIKLDVDMGYTRSGLDELRKDLHRQDAENKAEIKLLWKAIEELRKYRWRLSGLLAGVSGASSIVGGVLVKILFH